MFAWDYAFSSFPSRRWNIRLVMIVLPCEPILKSTELLNPSNLRLRSLISFWCPSFANVVCLSVKTSTEFGWLTQFWFFCCLTVPNPVYLAQIHISVTLGSRPDSQNKRPKEHVVQVNTVFWSLLKHESCWLASRSFGSQSWITRIRFDDS